MSCKTYFTKQEINSICLYVQEPYSNFIYLFIFFYASGRAGQVKFQRSGPDISNRKLKENGDAQRFDPNLPKSKEGGKGFMRDA